MSEAAQDNVEMEATDVRMLFDAGRRVVVVLDDGESGTEIVGTVRGHRLGSDWPRYFIELDGLEGATLEVDSCEVFRLSLGHNIHEQQGG
jgi:hypothetical protein